MKRILFAIVFFLFCGEHAIAQNESQSQSFEKVFEVISSPQVFKVSFEELMRQLNGLCKQSTRIGKDQYKYGNVECEKDVWIDSFTISGGEDIGFIQASFVGMDKCVYMKRVLIKNFGKPSKAKSECAVDWSLKPLKKGGAQRYVGFEINQEKNMIYFRIGEDQGP